MLLLIMMLLFVFARRVSLGAGRQLLMLLLSLLLMASIIILMIVTVVVHEEGEPWSWEAIPADSAHFTSDISPLILAAHTDNYEIIKVSLSSGLCLFLYLALLAVHTNICRL